MKPQDLGGGRFIVRRTEHFANWCAWRSWLHRETGRTVFPEKICVWSEWPPETMLLAQSVCQKIAEARKKIGYDFPVCDPAQPWDRWTSGQREDLERRHRDDFYWDPKLPAYRGSAQRLVKFLDDTTRELDDWMRAEAAKRPTVARGKAARLLSKITAGGGEERPTPAYLEASPELKAQRLAALERRMGGGT